MQANYFKVFSKRIAHELCKQGFYVIGQEINNQCPWLFVYLFEDTPQLRESFTKIAKEGRHEERN